MKQYEITNMIIDDEFDFEEAVTAAFTYNSKDYSITFNKADMEVINNWVFEEETSLPANLSDGLIESLREDIIKMIN